MSDAQDCPAASADAATPSVALMGLNSAGRGDPVFWVARATGALRTATDGARAGGFGVGLPAYGRGPSVLLEALGELVATLPDAESSGTGTEGAVHAHRALAAVTGSLRVARAFTARAGRHRTPAPTRTPPRMSNAMPRPGSPAAVAADCTCPIVINTVELAGQDPLIAPDCPLHRAPGDTATGGRDPGTRG